ncbi:hypothetical protein PMZ80_001941 [Knufia obscura]|uniref:Uncharacterized protein n=1 Tax=Knufia obscura TaxID=1635080 RepID=A0ABR0RVY5_9EURO|nr:hypothetical protein PMZ80_001941 [Knufia obscura]
MVSYNRQLTELNYARLGDMQCTCPCKCSGNESDSEDSDYEYSSESEDEIDNPLTGRATEAEQTMARKHGWKTNVISNEGQDQERRLFYEAPGHHAVGLKHDLGIPQESSLSNSENTVGTIEASRLDQCLEPWELEAVHHATGRPYAALARPFPEARYMQLPTNWHPDQHQEPTPMCSHCDKPYSEEFMRWVQEGNALVCSTCRIVKTPHNQAEDPDYQNFRIDHIEAMSMCACRCTCQQDVYSPTTDIDSGFREALIQTASVSERVPFHPPSSPAGRLQTWDEDSLSEQSNVDSVLDTTIHLAWSDSGSLPDFGSLRMGNDIDPGFDQWSQDFGSIAQHQMSTASPEVDEDRRETRERYNLPNLRFSDNPDRREASLEETQMALQDAQTAEAREDWEEAFNYHHAALFLGRDYYGNDSPALRSVRDEMRRLADLWEQQEEAELDGGI